MFVEMFYYIKKGCLLVRYGGINMTKDKIYIEEIQNNIAENIFIVSINRSHPFNFGEPPKDEYIKGAASGCWQADIKKLINCKYLVAIYENKVAGVFKIDKIIPASNAKEYIELLKKEIKYPHYRKYEMDAFTYENLDKMQKKFKHMYIFEKVINIDFKSDKRYKNFAKWKKRSFLILKDCDNALLANLKGEIIYSKKTKNFVLKGKTVAYF